MQIRKHLTYANVMATLSFVLVVAGGSAWAAGKLNGEQLKPKSVGTKAIAKGAITTSKLGIHAVSGDAVAPNSIGAEDLKALSIVKQSGAVTQIAQCPPGTVILTGAADSTGASISSSEPSGNGWEVGGAGTVTAIAYCLPS